MELSEAFPHRPLAVKVLKSNGITTVEQAQLTPEADLLKMRMIGPSFVHKIKSFKIPADKIEPINELHYTISLELIAHLHSKGINYQDKLSIFRKAIEILTK